MKSNHFCKSLFSIVIAVCLSPAAWAKPAPSPNLAPSAAIAGPSDAEIMHIFVTFNSIATEAANMAQKQSKNKDVIALANSLAKEHNEMSLPVTEFAKKAGLRPASNLTSQGFSNEARENTKKLKSLEGKDFDQAYLSSTLSLHDNAVAQMDENLLANVKDNELKSLLLKVRPMMSLQVTKIKKTQMDLSK